VELKNKGYKFVDLSEATGINKPNTLPVENKKRKH
jgi:hypothetical protein